MSQSNFPKETDSLGLVSGGVSYPEAGNINYLTSAMKAIETAFGENPLEAGGSGTPTEHYIFKDTLLEQFAEFLRIECGELQIPVRSLPLVDTSINSYATGQNNMVSRGYRDNLGEAMNCMNSTDWFAPDSQSVGQPPFGPRIGFTNSEMFTGGEDTRFFGWVSVVTRQPGQDNWSQHLSNNIIGDMPEPFDYPSPVGICSQISSTGIDLWLNIGDSTSNGGWNEATTATGSNPFAINTGQDVRIRYCAVEVGWLP